MPMATRKTKANRVEIESLPSMAAPGGFKIPARSSIDRETHVSVSRRP